MDFGAAFNSQWGVGTEANSTMVESGSVTLGTNSNPQTKSYLLVLEDQGPSTSGGNDTLSLWVDPNPGAVPNESPLITDTLAQVGTVSGFQLDSGGSSLFDELRVGTSYADVTPVPDPATVGLFAIGGLGLLLLRRRRDLHLVKR
ncbi:MAG: PEP-CTERM sorting domain-containing protein [Phycisphaerae bacterium]